MGDHKAKERSMEVFEKAARIYCQRTGQDPDATVEIPHETLKGVKSERPFWHFIADRLADLQIMIVSIAVAKRQFENQKAGDGKAPDS